jgi:hypothetical protein
MYIVFVRAFFGSDTRQCKGVSITSRSQDKLLWGFPFRGQRTCKIKEQSKGLRPRRLKTL